MDEERPTDDVADEELQVADEELQHKLVSVDEE